MALADIQQLLQDFVPGMDDEVTPEARTRVIEEARIRYSMDVPRTLVEQFVWPQTSVFAPLPSGWTDAAQLVSVDVAGRNAFEPALHFAVFKSGDDWQLEGVNALAAGTLVVLTYTLPHQLDAGADTIPAAHRLAVAYYAAYLLCQQLATRFSSDRDSTLNVDMARNESRATAFSKRAKEYRTAYFTGTGQVDPFNEKLSGNGLAAAASVTSWPRRNPRHNLVSRGGL
ncbi:hypothetical protein G7047_19270 [Diaphorobacter sp. HDW4A]|uniref:hypothetical protein n=1 Tax=Diaphorobacter sp. HDW4A TaxID=2714924 RepID=UPI00140BF0D8|nr:hypothetical protein [Diaphorobacter sp. HDW4A]QIL81818.1 hypothetical protein G7047_19270 [Diaphorobacter sp. HDW4A]